MFVLHTKSYDPITAESENGRLQLKAYGLVNGNASSEYLNPQQPVKYLVNAKIINQL